MKVLVLVLSFTCCSFAQSPSEATETAETLIAADDVLDIVVFREPELTRTVRVSSSGLITMPLTGNVRAAGLTTDALAGQIKGVLEKSLKDPDVTVSIKELGLQTISVIGAVRTPGAYPVRGAIPLLSLLAKAGSISDNADDTIQVIRKSAGPDGVSVISVGTEDLFRNAKTDLNIPIYAGDTVNVVQKPAAAFIMVIGEVLRPGEIPLRSPKGTTVRQALAASGWFTKQAKTSDARVIRIHPEDGRQEEIPINLKNVTDTSFDDKPLKANDILFIPSSRSKAAYARTLELAIGITSTRLIYIGR